jgi:hypothetical protein
LHVKAISEAVDEAAPLNRDDHENLRAGWSSRVLALAFVRPEAGLAGSDPALARTRKRLVGPAAASVRPEAKLAGSVSAWAEVLDPCLQTAEGEEAWLMPSVGRRR